MASCCQIRSTHGTTHSTMTTWRVTYSKTAERDAVLAAQIASLGHR